MAERTAEGRRERMYPSTQAGKGGKTEKAAEGSKAEERDEVAHHPAEAKKEEAEAKPGGERESIHEKHKTARREMHRRHESERRDMHGNHREELRQMAARHEKEHAALNEGQDADMMTAASGAVPGTAGEPQAAGVAGATPPAATPPVPAAA